MLSAAAAGGDGVAAVTQFPPQDSLKPCVAPALSLSDYRGQLEWENTHCEMQSDRD